MLARRIVSWALIGLCSAGVGLAQEQQKAEGGDDLAQQARNPTASLTMFQVLVNYTGSFHNFEDASLTSLTLMPVIPFQLGKTSHVARVTLPFVLSSPDWATLAGLIRATSRRQTTCPRQMSTVSATQPCSTS